MQLDLGHLRVQNEFCWFGFPEKDPSAVHLDILDAEVIDFCFYLSTILELKFSAF